MKKHFLKICSALILTVTAFTAHALEIKSEADVAGTWELQATARSLDGAQSSSNKEVWIIQNGKLEMKGLVKPRGDAYDVPAMDVSFEDGKMRIPVMGRAGKFRDYTLEQKTEDGMVLKGSEGYLFFKKK
ncbi:MAG: hypothetical protein ACU837_02460 [Gammaproteobacteria bacterium]